ncbi:pumilio/PUF RNA binding protein 4, putative [Trypanosoma cruzi marinkellei]|uniref:Pumilio/PUF RNA binding protein 4, putative n=1 Tax=Trypanosoma cruzi marinkellei TaxID=85056 RepID=K2MXF4_TRYCR|nr:pumilio/PUF RNA binding protein 4, putative [Trypanosoma cruzi marinkellei]
MNVHMDADSRITWNLSSLLAEVAAVKAAKEGGAGDTQDTGEGDVVNNEIATNAAAEGDGGGVRAWGLMCGERKRTGGFNGNLPHRTPLIPASFCSLAADVNGGITGDAPPMFFDSQKRPEATAGGWVSAATTANSSCGYHAGKLATSPENMLKTPSTSPFSVVAGLTPSAYGASATKPSTLPTNTSTNNTNAATVGTTSATSTPFWMIPNASSTANGVSLAIANINNSNNHHNNTANHLCGRRGGNDPLSSLNLLLNLSPVNTPTNSAGTAAGTFYSPRSKNVMLSGGPYTLQQSEQQKQQTSQQQQQQQRQQQYTEMCHSVSEPFRGALMDPQPLVRHATACQLPLKGPDNPTAAAATTTNPSSINTNTKNNIINSNMSNAKTGLRGSNHPWVFPDDGWSSLRSSSTSSPLRELAGFLGPKSCAAPNTRHLHHGHHQQRVKPRVPLIPSSSGERNRATLASSERKQTTLAGGSTELHRDAVFPPVPLEMPQYRGHVVEMASDQHGCRELQSVLERYPYRSQEVQCVVNELLPCLPQVMASSYGNFLVQKLLEIAPDEDRLQMLSQHLSGSLCEVAVSPHGNYAVQKLIDSLRSRREVEVVCAALQRGVLMLMNDLNGGHVVQKLIQCLPQDVAFVYDAIVEMTIDVCNDKQGCCVVQKCMDSAPPERLPQLQEAVLKHLLPLCMSPYGNYVVAHLIRHCDAMNQRHVVDRAAVCVGPALKMLCTNKFASNVVEIILSLCSEEVKVQLCRSLLQGSNEKTLFLFQNNIPGNSQDVSLFASSSSSSLPQNMQQHHDTSTLSTIALNQFGNYVVQKMLSVLPVCTELIQLIHHLHRMLPLLLDMNFGKRVETKMEQSMARIVQHYQQKGITTVDMNNCTTAVGQTELMRMFQHSTHKTDITAMQQQQQVPVASAATAVALNTRASMSSVSQCIEKTNFGDNVHFPHALFAAPLTPQGTSHQQQQQGARHRNRRDTRASDTWDRKLL